MLPIILLIDDESRAMDGYFQELKLEFKEQYDVTFINDVDSANKFLQEEHDKIKLVILDIMMPPGELFKNSETDKGLRTGVRFYKEIRKKFLNLPIIIFTNFSNEPLEEEVDKNEKTQFLRKYECLPFELVEVVQLFLDQVTTL